jgi:hypothetical protein
MPERPIIPEILDRDAVLPSDAPLPLDLVALRHLAVLLDEAVPIPGTTRRVGLDAGLGLVPVVGDVVGALISTWIVIGALRHRVPLTKVWRMVANILIDVALGSIPLVGDVFDVFWNQNMANVDLIVRHRNRSLPPRRVSEIAVAAAFILGIFVLLLIAVVVAAAVGVAWLIRHRNF